MISFLRRPVLLFLGRVNFRIRRKFGEKLFTIPIKGGLGLGLRKVHEEDLLLAFANLLPATRGHFLDVGANVGQTLLAVRSIDPNMSYAGFEPNTIACGYCQEPIWVNKFENAVVIPIALGESNQIAHLFLQENGDSVDSCASL